MNHYFQERVLLMVVGVGDKVLEDRVWVRGMATAN